ncbi:MAG: NACHT domain-containing protein, partial [Parachlamydiaceae bacterium]
MEPVRNTVSQENVITRDFVIIRDAVDSQEILLHHFINPQPLTLKGICQHNKAILHIYTGKNPNKIDTYRATRAKNGGCALGAIHEQTTLKTYRSAREWLGKVGAPKGLLRHNTDTYCTRTEKEINIDTIREKLAYDLYKELGRGYFEVPRTRLARQPFVDEFMPSSMSLTMFMIVNRDVIQDTLRIMSRLVDGYSDFKHAKVLDSNQQSIPFLEFIKTYHRPPEELLTAEGKTVPLYGFMEMIAVARILGDTDALGGTADNAGFVWIKENDEIVGAQTYKIDPGCAFCFTHDESDSSPSPSWVINKIKGLAGKCVSDHRDFQTAQNYFPSVIEWEALTIQQQETFLGILFNSSRYLSSNVLGFLFHRNGAFFLDEKAYLPKDIADQFQNEFKEWLTIQFTIYDEELHAFHAKYPEQALRAYYIDACGEITLPMKNQSFPIGELFTDLALISKKQTIHLLPEVDSLKATKVEGMASSELVDLSNIFDQNRTVLLLGRAGIGKSSLCQKIAHSWASGELWNDRFDLLFWLPLNLLNELSVGDNANHFLTEIVLPYLFKQLPGFSHLNIEKKRVLFVLDGYDEASKELANRVESLLTDTPYSFFIASRPEKIHLCVDQTIENMGFSEQRIEEYIQKFSECQGAKQNHTLYNLIKKNPCLESIAHVPLLLQMVVSLYDKEGTIANFATLTNLYAKMVDALYEWNLPNDPQKEENLLYLAKIASVGFKSGKLLISPKMISRPIDRELLRTGLLKESEKTGSLYFVHLSFQEYLTALYISRSTPEKQRGFIDKWRYESSHQLVLSFLAGLMHAQGKAGDF